MGLISLGFVIKSCSSEKATDHLPFYNSPDFTPIFLTDTSEANAMITHKIKPFNCMNELGEKISEKHIEHKVHIANFMFTSCGSICPRMTENLRLVSSSFKNNADFLILSYSVTPWIDNTERLRAYKMGHEIQNPNWHFLNGNKSEIYQLARESYFAEEDLGFTKDSTDFLHTEHVILVDQNSRIRGIYNGTLELEMQQLIKDINVLLTVRG